VIDVVVVESGYWGKILVRNFNELGVLHSVILCGHTIGRYGFIGAGAGGVTMDVPYYALMLGNPAKITGWLCECGHQLHFQDGLATCDECGNQYRQTDKGVICQEESGAREAVGEAKKVRKFVLKINQRQAS